jgi:hypothetical protein
LTTTLATGGAGMAGGFWVLGGIVAAPIIYLSTKSSYKKANVVKEEKFKLVKELDKLSKIKIKAQIHLEEVKKQRLYVSKIVDEVVPELEVALSTFKNQSSWFYRIFGGKMSEKQKITAERIAILSSESLHLLGFK